ncbi:MAG: hypothetical protein WCB11_10850, partial [Terriglobales bacterium]
RIHGSHPQVVGWNGGPSPVSDRVGHWHSSNVFVPQTDTATWGANLPGSPIWDIQADQDRLTLFLIPVARWSDGTAVAMDKH